MQHCDAYGSQEPHSSLYILDVIHSLFMGGLTKVEVD